jgi:hypothetical protein
MLRRFALLLLTCPLWLAPPACSKKTEEPARHREIPSTFESFPKGAGKREFERWYLAELQGKSAGWIHTWVSRHETPTGPRWVIDSEEFMVVRRGADRIEGRIRKKFLENERGQLLRFWQLEQEQGGEEVTTQAGKAGAEMVTIRGPEIHRIPFEPEARSVERGYLALFAGKRPQAGEVKQYRSYDSMWAGYEDVQVAVKSVDAKVIEIEQTASSLPGVVTRIRLDEACAAIRAEAQVGVLHLVFRMVKEKPDLITEGAAPDMDPLMVIKSNVQIENSREVRQIRYRIEGLPDFVDSNWMTGPGQKVIASPSPGVFVLEVTMLGDPPPSPFPPAVKDPELKKHLMATSLTRLDDPEIIKTARKVTAKAPDAWTAAKRLRRWVSEEVEGSMGMGFASASQTMKEREGDCSEQAVLLTALARTVGIPARCVKGLVYQDGSFYRHMWTEVWVGRWQPLDPAQATDFISAAWIRLAVYSLQLTDDDKTGAGGLVLFATSLKVKVEKVEPAKR